MHSMGRSAWELVASCGPLEWSVGNVDPKTDLDVVLPTIYPAVCIQWRFSIDGESIRKSGWGGWGVAVASIDKIRGELVSGILHERWMRGVFVLSVYILLCLIPN